MCHFFLSIPLLYFLFMVKINYTHHQILEFLL